MKPQLAVIYDDLLRCVGMSPSDPSLHTFSFVACRRKMDEMSGKLGRTFRSTDYTCQVNDNVLRRAKAEYKVLFGAKASVLFWHVHVRVVLACTRNDTITSPNCITPLWFCVI